MRNYATAIVTLFVGKVRTAHRDQLKCGHIYSLAQHRVELMEMRRESIFEGSF
jgi:hypothetical protein